MSTKDLECCSYCYLLSGFLPKFQSSMTIQKCLDAYSKSKLGVTIHVNLLKYGLDYTESTFGTESKKLGV